MSEIDQQFVEYVVKSLVGNPDAVQIKRTIDEKGVLLELTVDPEDLGRVIGKRGATAQSLRTLLRALGTKNEARYNLKIVDNGDPEHRRAQPAADNTADNTSDNSKPAGDSDAVATEQSNQSDEQAPDDASEETQTSDRLRQARQELSDLDDLDI